MTDTVDAHGMGGKAAARGSDTKTDTDGQLRQGATSGVQESQQGQWQHRYRMNHPKRGCAVIINNKNFAKMPVRTGTDKDANAMYELLDTLRFEHILKYNDLTASNMKEKLKEASQINHKDSDCFVCVILSHGEKDTIWGTDKTVPVEDLVLPFKGHNCPTLAGKPKIFFIQACRGDKVDGGVNVADAVGYGKLEDIDVRRIPTEADFLMAYSVVPGHYAWRHQHRGSWFIQAVFDVIKNNWREMNLLNMMTRVNRKVAYEFESKTENEHMNKKKQMPCITSMLTKDVYF
jgi:caspase 7